MPAAFPSTEDLESFFGCRACETAPDDGLMVFDVKAGNAHLKVFINEVAFSLQTIMHLDAKTSTTVCSEGLEEITIMGDTIGPYLQARFKHAGLESRCVIRLEPICSVRWGSIVN